MRGSLRQSTQLMRSTGDWECAASARGGGGGKKLARRVATGHDGVLLGMDLRNRRATTACSGARDEAALHRLSRMLLHRGMPAGTGGGMVLRPGVSLLCTKARKLLKS